MTLASSQVFVQFRIQSMKFSHLRTSGHPDDDVVVVAAAPPAPPVFAAPRPLSADPVTELLVSLLLRPVGWKRCIGIFGSLPMNLLATIGPTINARKMMNMMK